MEPPTEDSAVPLLTIALVSSVVLNSVNGVRRYPLDAPVECRTVVLVMDTKLDSVTENALDGVTVKALDGVTVKAVELLASVTGSELAMVVWPNGTTPGDVDTSPTTMGLLLEFGVVLTWMVAAVVLGEPTAVAKLSIVETSPVPLEGMPLVMEMVLTVAIRPS